MDVSVKPGRNRVSIMLSPPASQRSGAPPLPAPPLSSPGEGWDLGAPWVVRDYGVGHRHDDDNVSHRRDHGVGHHRDDETGLYCEDKTGHRRDDDVGHRRDDDVGHHHENDLRVPPPPSAAATPPRAEGRGPVEQQLLPLSLLKEALAPLCLRLAAVEAGLERLWLRLPLLVTQGGGTLPDGGGAVSGGGARRRRSKGATPRTVTTPPVSSHLTCTSPLLTAMPSLATGTPSLATGTPSYLTCRSPLATATPSRATVTPSLLTGMPSLATGTPSLATVTPSLLTGMPSLATLPLATGMLQTTQRRDSSTMEEGLNVTEECELEGEEPDEGKRKWSLDSGNLALKRPAGGSSHLVSGERGGVSSGQWEELKELKRRRVCGDIPTSCPSASVIQSQWTVPPIHHPSIFQSPLHQSGNMLLPFGQSRLPLSLPNGVTHHFLFVRDNPACRACPVDRCPPVGLSLVQIEKPRSQSGQSQDILSSQSERHSTIPPSQSQTSTPPPSQSQTSTPPPSQSQTSTPPPSQSQTFTPPPSQSQTSTPPPSQSETSTPTPSQSWTSTPPPSQSQISNPPPSQSQTSTPPPSQSQISNPPPSQSEGPISGFFWSSFPASQSESCSFTLHSPEGQSLTSLLISPPHVSMTTGLWLRPLHALARLSPFAIETATRCLLATAGQWPPLPPLRDLTAPPSLQDDHRYCLPVYLSTCLPVANNPVYLSTCY
ncbi:P-selectin glycoprotein ligand 1 [Merluccius polli]|uniref:P-selectin glycoprotein ligand 1 n=1 Tax=Merluccius polli TaxID=89951 RepID=A0AA47MJE4_MERPO|nr:P-selectin glycoprotein ligand 1 [Merluccius polli]